MKQILFYLIFIYFSLSDLFGQNLNQTTITGENEYERLKTKITDRLKNYYYTDDSDYIKIDKYFYEKHLSSIEEFQLSDDYLELFYHSIPDIKTINSYLVLKAIFKYDLYSYSYYLIDIDHINRKPFELAGLYEYPDGLKRIKSSFINDSTIQKIEIGECLGDYNEKNKDYETIVDSITFVYRIKKEDILLIAKDSIRTIK